MGDPGDPGYVGYVVVARDHGGRTIVFGSWPSRETAQREMDFLKPTLDDGTVECFVAPVRSAWSRVDSES